MAEKTGGEHLHNPTNSASEKIILPDDTKNINANQEIEDMEVHHHAHDAAAPHHKKNWKSYFWEFLMLFLAVFCGFLAEYQLEHKIEKDRAKELAKDFYLELRNDSVSVAEKYQNRINLENSLEYLASYFKDSSLTNLPNRFVVNFHKGLFFRAPSLFEPRTAVLEQLKNSGSLRYFKNEELKNLIGDISVSIHNVNDRQSFENNYRQTYITPLLIKHYDSDFELATRKIGDKNLNDFLSTYERSDTIIPFRLNALEAFNTKETNNLINLFAINSRGTRSIQFQEYIEVNAKLLKLLRKEYHIK